MTPPVYSQTTPRIFMVRPVRFGYNEQTAESNEFMDAAFAESTRQVAQERARAEFDRMVDLLRSNGVDVTVFEDTPDPYSPDSIFPNNWISTHADGEVLLYPMMAPNRRVERRADIVNYLREHFAVSEIIDLSYFEKQEKYLEATGSMVLDRPHRIAYACLSPRTHPEVLSAFAAATGYEVVSFEALDGNGVAIYHTNVLMCVGDCFVVVCMEAVRDAREREVLYATFAKTGKRVVEITLDQVAQFAGNMLLVQGSEAQPPVLVMSDSAYHALTETQRGVLGESTRLLHTDLSVVEGNGGGSARCMMAEIHLAPKRRPL